VAEPAEAKPSALAGGDDALDLADDAEVHELLMAELDALPASVRYDGSGSRERTA
jgi:hypothetical protein